MPPSNLVMKLIRNSIAAFSAALVAACGTGAADRVLQNGKIVTVDYDQQLAIGKHP